MAKDLDRATLIEIYSSKEKIEAFNMFGILWNKRQDVFNEMIRELLKKNDFLEHPDENKNTLYFKIDDNLSLVYQVKDWYFGFVYTPGGKGFSKRIQEKLIIVLEHKKLKDIFVEEPASSGKWRVGKTVDIDKIGDCKSLILMF